MASLIYNSARVLFAQGAIDWVNDDIRVLLVYSGYTPDVDAHDFVDDVTNEVSGTGYARKVLVGKTVTKNNTTDRADCGADNPIWTGLDAGTPAAAVIYKEGASDAARSLIAYVDFIDTASAAADWELLFNSGVSSGLVLSI